jgi:hypothetical protein
MSQQRGPMGDQATQREQLRRSVTDQQRNQYRVCSETAQRVRTRSREMVRLARGTKFNAEAWRQLHVQLQSEIQVMEEEHERLMQELGDEQRAATQQRTREMEEDLESLDVWMQAMDDELAESEPDAKQLAGQARKVEKAAKEWEKDNKDLGADLGLNE